LAARRGGFLGPHARHVLWCRARGGTTRVTVAIDPAKFVREVRTEMSRVTWPTRKETLTTTAFVFVLSVLAAIFFLIVDQLIGWGISLIFGFRS
jgi:preprotein translocase subunit SecE